MRLPVDKKQKRLSPPKIGILLFTVMMLMVTGCTLPSSSAKAQSETQLATTLSNLFTRGWFDQCNTLQNVAKMAIGQEPGKSADYLLGYLQGGSPSRPGHFLRNDYFIQSELKDQLTPTEVRQSLDLFTAAESDYLEQLKNRLETDGRVPQEEAFQKNTRELADLIPYMNVRADNLIDKREVKLFQKNLEKAIQLMKAAFPRATFAGAFSPSDNIIVLPAS